MTDPIVIVGAARTPLGAFQGSYSPLSANELGAVAIRAALERSGVAAESVDEVLMGNVLSAGQGQAPARQAAIRAGIPASVGATTISKVCGSGMQAVIYGHDSIKAETNAIVVTGGMESMTNAPYLLPQARGGYRIGHGVVYDHMMLDGLEDAYDKGQSMGTFGETCAEKYAFSRAEQDAFAIASVERSQAAMNEGAFGWETASVTVPDRKGDILVEHDERLLKLKPEKIPALKPAFKTNGTITAASSSANADGAAALVMMRSSTAEKLGLRPIARILGHASHAQEPEWFTTAPVEAIKKLYRKVGLSTAEVDLFEVNEAFAAVTMATMRDHNIPHEKMNVHGGACALGHPIGATGARIVVTLLGAMRHRGCKTGIASLCIGGGEATAVAIEMM